MSESIELEARDREAFYVHETPLRQATVWAARLAFTPLIKLKVNGLQHLLPEGPMILASNHVSNFDVFAMQFATPRTIFYMGKAELFRFTPMGALLRNFGAFPVYRGAQDAWALAHARKVLEAGQALGMFPEGHRSKGGGLGLAKTGTARLAIETGCPIVPMVLIGTDKILRGLPRQAEVGVTFLPCLKPSAGEGAAELTNRLMRAIADALPRAMRGQYA